MGAGICSLYQKIHYFEVCYIKVWVYKVYGLFEVPDPSLLVGSTFTKCVNSCNLWIHRRSFLLLAATMFHFGNFAPIVKNSPFIFHISIIFSFYKLQIIFFHLASLLFWTYNLIKNYYWWGQNWWNRRLCGAAASPPSL